MFSFGKSKADSKELEKKLSKSLKRKVSIDFSLDGVRRILIEPNGKALKLRLDPLFKEINHDYYEALVKFIQLGDEHSKSELIEYLRIHKNKLPVKDTHTFQSTLNQLRNEHFPLLPPLKLVRGKEGKKGEQKSIRLASYWAKRKEIRLHPYLEIEGVPEYYLQFLIYHELCHAQLVMSGQAKDGEHHGPDFIKLEKKFPMIEEAIDWENHHLATFLEQCKSSRNVF